MKVITYFVGFAAVYICVSGFPFEKTVRIVRFINCPQNKNLPMYVDGTQFTQINRVYYITTKIIAKRDIEPNVKMIFQLERCKSRENPDSCEHYGNVNIKDICTLAHQDHMPWSEFSKNMDPPLYCPYKKGVYTTRNTTFDATALSVLLISGWFWKLRMLLLEPSADISMPVMCVYGEGEIVNV